MAGHDDRAFDVRRIDPEIGDQRLGEAFYRELCRRIGGMRNARPDRRPETVDAAGIDDVALLSFQQHRQEGAGAVVNSAPTDVEGPLPFLSAVGDHTAAAADTGIVEEEMDLIGAETLGDLVAKSLDLRLVGYIGEMRRDTQALRQPRRLAQPPGFRHPLRRDIAHRDIAGLGGQLAYELSPHSRTAPCDDRDPAREILHLLPPSNLVHHY